MTRSIPTMLLTTLLGLGLNGVMAAGAMQQQDMMHDGNMGMEKQTMAMDQPMKKEMEMKQEMKMEHGMDGGMEKKMQDDMAMPMK